MYNHKNNNGFKWKFEQFNAVYYGFMDDYGNMVNSFVGFKWQIEP